MKTLIAAILLTAGFTIMGNGTESFPMVVVICIAKIAMIFGGGCLLIHGQEDEI